MLQTLTRFDNRKHWIWLLLVVSALLHLCCLSTPNSVVFDEFHFGKFINAYGWSHENVFSIHPAHPNIIMAGLGRLFGYDGTFTYGAIGEVFHTNKIWTLRIFPALCGTVFPIAVLYLLLQFGVSFAAAMLGAALVLFDNCLILQSRIIAYDVPMLLGDVCALLFLLKGIREKKISKALLWFFISGLFSGFALSCKFTALISIGSSGLLLLYATFRKKIPVEKMLLGSALVGFGFLLFYLGGWWLHFYLLYKPGPGDVYFVATGNFIQDTIKMHQAMFNSNYFVRAGHPDGSPWWAWPMGRKPLYYWNLENQKLFFLPNAVIWWFSLVTFGTLLFHKTIGRFSFKNLDNRFQRFPIIWLCIFLFFWSYLSYSMVPRVLFLYHYLPPLLFSLLASVLFLEEIRWFKNPEKLLQQHRGYYFVLVMIFLGFLFFLPITYGFPIGKGYDYFITAFFIR